MAAAAELVSASLLCVERQRREVCVSQRASAHGQCCGAGCGLTEGGQKVSDLGGKDGLIEQRGHVRDRRDDGSTSDVEWRSRARSNIPGLNAVRLNASSAP